MLAVIDSIGVVLRCANPYGMPAAEAARATATSPSGWKSRVPPVGDRMRGSAAGPPSTVVLRSRFSIAPQRGTKDQSSKLDRLRRSETSSSAPPSR